MVLNFEKEFLLKELKERNPRKVLVQLPEGIKQNAFEIQKEIEKLGIEVVFSGETCWGGCSVSVKEAKSVGADLIVHFGHAPFINVDFPVLYVEVKDELDLSSILNKSLEFLKEYDKIGFSYSIQHRHDLEKVKKFYEDNGKEIILSSKKGKVAYEGHIVGCQYFGLKDIQNKVDCFLVLGNRFHGIGASLSVKEGKQVFLLDVYNDMVEEMSKFRENFVKERAISIEKFKEAKKIGVILETKLGQTFGNGKFIANILKESGKDVILIVMSELSNDKLMNFYDVEAFVELACPRIAIDDFKKYQKPILTLREALVAIGKKDWKEFLEEGVL